MAKLPKVLYVRAESCVDDEIFYLAEAEIRDAIEDDGPSRIGVYRLVETKTARKTVAVTGPEG